MKARIIKQEEEEKWDAFVARHPLATVHQTSDWGHFQRKTPTRGEYWIIVVEEDGKWLGGTMLIRHGMRGNMTWLYCARGPLLDYDSHTLQEQMDALLTPIKEIAKKENSVFVRIDPPILKKHDAEKPPRVKRFMTTHLGFQPENTLIIDLSKTQKDILAQMKQKGRYNIRLAEKKGVKIRESDPKDIVQFESDLVTFHKILHETTTRDHFYGHKKDFYKHMLETLYSERKTDPQARLCLAEFKGKIIAGVIITYYKDTAIYYYGASSNNYRNLMGPYLLQWHAIREAHKQGLSQYDFLGISPPNVKEHAWMGVTDFKKKFGGEPITYLPPQEYSFSTWKYILYRIVKAVRG